MDYEHIFMFICLTLICMLLVSHMTSYSYDNNKGYKKHHSKRNQKYGGGDAKKMDKRLKKKDNSKK